jgi:hypothetical protein
MSQVSSPDVTLQLVVHQLRFTLEAQTRVEFGRQAGAQLRGALWAALEQFACTDPRARTPEHQRYCPMCRLVNLELGTGSRGANPPRPFAIRPPLAEDGAAVSVFKPGETFTIGISLFGDVADLFPYVCQAVYRMGELGVGYGRGRFIVRDISEQVPFSSATVPLFSNGKVQALPHQPVTHTHVQAAAERLPSDSLTLHFLTPTQITGDAHIHARPVFDKLVGRLIERCQAMQTYYTDTPVDQEVWRAHYLDLVARAQSVRITEQATRWMTVLSGSRRSGRYNAISGFVGHVTFTGDLRDYRYWLVWGSVLNVGKNVVKGNGWYLVS